MTTSRYDNDGKSRTDNDHADEGMERDTASSQFPLLTNDELLLYMIVLTLILIAARLHP